MKKNASQSLAVIIMLFAAIIIGYKNGNAEDNSMPFKFDIWEAGMDEVDILRIAKNNNINLMDETDSYRYSTKLLDEYASVKLYLTAKTRKLMEVSISWNNGRKVKGGSS